ncbi:MAG TPA: penicillin-binding transpeptidase domain-containing protein [Clostridia bacterium]|nr:penicillin-binding transpeptidase domain-containing protein [Clostridia bacterium]
MSFKGSAFRKVARGSVVSDFLASLPKLTIVSKSALAVFLVLILTASSFAATVSPRRYSSSNKKVSENPKAQKRISRLKHSRPVASKTVARSKKSSKKASARKSSVRKRASKRRYYERFSASSFVNDDQTSGDITAGEDPVVRQAAIDALGNMNGTIVAIDPDSGRVLTMVNQKLALSEGAQPCSTIKVAVALAALSEGIVKSDTKVSLGRTWKMNLTQALAHSNNAYFEALGRRMGFEKVRHYANQYGLGEMAGWNIEGEHLGTYPNEVLAAKLGGVGKMCSFGESVSMTPLQLGALVASIANGGTLYYMQHPTSPDEIANFQPKVKRYLDIAPLIPEVMPGMAGAVNYGTARSLRGNFSEEEVLGKTGTCSKDGTRFGWFASYANTQYGRVVTVVFLRGGRPTFGPKAAEVAGRMYRTLYDHSFFAGKSPVTPVRDTAGSSAVGARQ